MNISGVPQLQARLKAVGGAQRDILNRWQLLTVAGAKRLVPRRTGNLARTIYPGPIGSTTAQVYASASYAAAVEQGSRPHVIRPVRRKALRWGTGARRLTGTPTKAAVRAGQVQFAKVVHHPGTKPHPFLMPAAEKALKDTALVGEIVAAWNGAA